MLRPDRSYTPLEGHVLDIALHLHMEHGGGNNSTFTTRVVTSSGSDTYSVMAAALSSLKGPKHGGANIKVMEMCDDIRAHVKDVADDDELKAYLSKIVDKEAFDRKGLIYGMGHAGLLSDRPARRCLQRVRTAAGEAKGRKKDFDFYNAIERLAPQVIAEKRHIYKGVSTTLTSTAALSTTCWTSGRAVHPDLRGCPHCRLECPPHGRALSMWTRSSAPPTKALCRRGSTSRLKSGNPRGETAEKGRRLVCLMVREPPSFCIRPHLPAWTPTAQSPSRRAA